ncbi:MAG: lipoate--protein ligase family protein [Candidatus Eiseniibacteriota bacterium]|jgi:lipoate-protein ligase A
MSSYERAIYLLEDPGQDPAWNMAIDDALLDARNSGCLDGTWFRLFSWRPPAITLGRLQAVDTELDIERLAADGVVVVRRATGGKAVYHADELTYSVIGGLDDAEWGDSLHATYRAVTSIIADGLARLGIATGLAARRPAVGGEAALDGDALRAACFAVTFGHELVYEGRKICGSAQRRLVHAFLQHGSLLLGDAHVRLADWVRTDRDRRVLGRRLRSEVADVRSAAGRAVSWDEVAAALRASLRDRFGERLQPTALPAALHEAARQRLDSVRVALATGTTPSG